jgi:tetratricopeptide (TPR) repeat protein
VYFIQCHWNKAFKEFELAVKAEPDNAEYLRGLGWALFNEGNKLKGLGYLHKTIELEPASVNILLDLANAHLIMLDFNNAKVYVDKALLIDPGNGLARQVREKIREIHKTIKRTKDQT